MIDTIKFELQALLKMPSQCQIPLPSGKYITSHTRWCPMNTTPSRNPI
jgi:hypothetical protein